MENQNFITKKKPQVSSSKVSRINLTTLGNKSIVVYKLINSCCGRMVKGYTGYSSKIAPFKKSLISDGRKKSTQNLYAYIYV